MAAPKTILVGTAGQGVMRTADGGETWQRISIDQGLHADAMVRALASDPFQPASVLAGTDRGLYQTEDAGAHWQHVDCAIGRDAVWSLARDPAEPRHMWAGTGTSQPAGVFRSEDGGQMWHACQADFAPDCPAVGVPRVTGLAIGRDGKAWASVEVDGQRFSQDGGETWQRVDPKQIPNPDGHNAAVVGDAAMILVNNDLYISRDQGESWQAAHAEETFGLRYCRGVAVKPGTETVFLAVGDSTPGRTGAIVRSLDAGRSWERLPLPHEPNSAMWVVSVQPWNTDVVLAGSRYGYLYQSTDGGDGWEKLWREVSEVGSLTWCP
jgi:photosystem II stability/assembly factor-like uncharacterized protein